MKNLICVVILGLMLSCQQSDPPEFGRVGDEVLFSGWSWDVKIYENSQQGPGPNYFSPYPEDVYVDDNGYLHMRIAEHDGKWFSSEIISQEVTGYGKYKFVIEGDFINIPQNTVAGLFTWDNTTFFTDGNSEIDVELSKWGNPTETNTLQYAVQPVFFGGYYPERVQQQETNTEDLIGVSTHIMEWTDSLLTFHSYRGNSENPADQIGYWTFDLDNPARVKEEGDNVSDPIIIPEPGPQTNVRINHWIMTWIHPGPIGEEPQEFIVREFEYNAF